MVGIGFEEMGGGAPLWIVGEGGGSIFGTEYRIMMKMLWVVGGEVARSLRVCYNMFCSCISC